MGFNYDGRLSYFHMINGNINLRIHVICNITEMYPKVNNLYPKRIQMYPFYNKHTIQIVLRDMVIYGSKKLISYIISVKYMKLLN